MAPGIPHPLLGRISQHAPGAFASARRRLVQWLRALNSFTTRGERTHAQGGAEFLEAFF
jgi:hypothetical protein